MKTLGLLLVCAFAASALVIAPCSQALASDGACGCQKACGHEDACGCEKPACHDDCGKCGGGDDKCGKCEDACGCDKVSCWKSENQKVVSLQERFANLKASKGIQDDCCPHEGYKLVCKVSACDYTICCNDARFELLCCKERECTTQCKPKCNKCKQDTCTTCKPMHEKKCDTCQPKCDKPCCEKQDCGKCTKCKQDTCTTCKSDCGCK